MRVLHVIPSLTRGGAERLVLDIVRHLRKDASYKVELVVLSEENAYHDEYIEVNPIHIKSYVIPSVKGAWRVNLTEWDAIIQEFKPNIIHSHLFAADLFVHYRPIPGVAYVTHCHDNMRQIKRLSPADLFNKTRLTEWYERRFMLEKYILTNNHFIAISEDTHRYFVQNLPKELGKHVHLLHNAIDYKRFSARLAKWEPSGVKRLVNVGSFVSKKNQRFLIEVMEILLGNDTRYELTLVGEGPLRESVENEVHKRNLQAHVHFTGSRSAVESILWDSHMMVHSATYEPFGLVLLEGMAAGLPIVSLDGRGNRILLEDQGKGRFLSINASPSEFAAAISSCFIDFSEWERLSKCSLAFSKAYGMETYINLLDLFYTNFKFINNN